MLINCVVYNQGKKVKDIPLSEVSEVRKNPGAFVWVALLNPTPEELFLVQEEFQLHNLAVEDALHGHQRPKVEEYNDVLFAVLNVPQLENDEICWGEINIFVGPSFVVSVRKKVAVGFQKVRDRCETEPHLLNLGSGFVFYALIDNIVDRYYPVIEILEERLEKIEENIFKSQANRKELEVLYGIKQQTMQFKHIIASSLDFVSKLFGGRVPKVCCKVQEYFRDVFDHLIRVEQSLDSIRDTIVTAMQVNLNLISM